MSAPTGLRLGAALTVVITTLTGVGTAPGADAADAVVAVPLSPCFSSDRGSPVLQRLTVSRSKVDVRKRAQSVVIDAVLPDTGGPGPAVGVFRASIVATHPKAVAALDVPMRHLDGDLWRARLRVPRGAQPGRWTLSVSSSDSAGNPPVYSTAPLTRHLQVVSSGDRHPPVLTRFAMSPSSIDARSARRRVHVAVDARDPGSGVKTVTLSVSRGSPFGLNGDAALHRVSGTAGVGRWRGHFDVPLWAPGGRWATGVTLTDRTGHTVSYGAARASHVRSSPRLPPLRVRSGVDQVAPAVASVTASRSAIDIRSAPAAVTIEVRLLDVTSGVASASAWIQAGFLSEYEVPLQLVEGTTADGLWRGTWTATTCRVAAGPRALRVVAHDRAGNMLMSPVGEPSIAVVNDDHIPPIVSGSEVTATKVSVFFTEDVVGVSTRSMLLFDYDTHQRPKPPFAGHWACQDAVAAEVDCTTGPVRVAAFVADAPMATFFHGLSVNPEHVLDVTDLAGNPYLGAPTYVGAPPKPPPR